MKVLLSLVFFALAVTAIPLGNETTDGQINGVNGWYVPNFDFSYVWMPLAQGEALNAKYELKEVQERPASPVSFYLYTAYNSKKAQQISADSHIISQTNFNPRSPTRIIIHGWTQNYTADNILAIRDAWLSNGAYNVILVNWERSQDKIYASAVAAVPGIGKSIANFLDYLVLQNGLSLADTHVIGYGLASHIAGYVGKNVRNGRLHTIIALDAALPLKLYNRTDERINSQDASYVGSIHTDIGQLGFVEPIGRLAFYPNGGYVQPGCESDHTGKCSHQRSSEYYAEAVRYNNFPAYNCGGLSDIIKGTCDKKSSGVKMSDNNNNYKLSGGVYFVPVNSKPLFGFGQIFG